jgi:PAS domain S-box-containing protein
MTPSTSPTGVFRWPASTIASGIADLVARFVSAGQSGLRRTSEFLKFMRNPEERTHETTRGRNACLLIFALRPIPTSRLPLPHCGPILFDQAGRVNEDVGAKPIHRGMIVNVENNFSPETGIRFPFADGDMAQQIRAVDWAATVVGPIENWSDALRFALDMMLGCAFPATLQWGRDLILFYNDAYIPLIGYRHPIALGKPIFDAFPEIVQTYRPLAERVWRGERIVLEDQPYRYARHEKVEDLWYDLSYSPIHEVDGTVAGIFAVGVNTTAKVLAERARSNADQRLRRVLETDAVGVIFFDYSGTVVDANQVFINMTGYSRAEIDARAVTWRTMTPPEWVKASEEQMEKLARTGRIGPYEKEYILKDGSRRWMLFAGRDLGDGTIAEYAVDVSDRKKAQETLLRTEKLATLGRLAASIAHEINNPLEATTNLLYLVQTSNGLPDGAKEHLDSAAAELQRVAHITRQSLGFYRESSGPSEVSVTQLIDDTIDLLRGKVLVKNIQVHRAWDGDVKVKAVPGELRQVFSNLLSNSLDALPPGGDILIRVKALGGTKDPNVRVTFADSGPGIPAQMHPRIFDPFFSTKGDRGTGLGLWVTKQLVEKHGGSIRMRSRSQPPRTGTAFAVTLPMGHLA